MIEMTKSTQFNYFCWEKANGRWSPKIYHNEIPESISNSAAGSMRASHTAPDSDIIRTKIQKIEQNISLSDCIALYPLRAE